MFDRRGGPVEAGQRDDGGDDDDDGAAAETEDGVCECAREPTDRNAQ